MNKGELAFNLEAVMGDFLDKGEYDLPYIVIEYLAKHLAGWILSYKKEIMELMKDD